MSQSTNVCEMSFETKNGLYRHQSYDSKHTELLEKVFGSGDEPMERVYDSEEEFYYLRPKPKIEIKPQTERIPKIESKPQTESKLKDDTKAIIKPETNPPTKLKPKTEDSIYSRIKYECKECLREFKNKIALTTHSYSYNCRYLENTKYFDINSSQNMKEFYITDKAGNYIEDIDEAANYSLEEIKRCYQFRKF